MIDIRKKNNSDIGFGGTIIIVIFVVLCLMILSTLSFMTAYSDLKLTKKTQEIAADYYAAHGKAEEKLEEIYSILSSETETSAKEKIGQLEGVVVSDGMQEGSRYSVKLEAEGEKNQKICAALDIFYDDEGRPYYEITSWNLANIELPEYEEEIYNLWEGIEEQ
jgi:hypothetical protein